MNLIIALLIDSINTAAFFSCKNIVTSSKHFFSQRCFSPFFCYFSVISLSHSLIMRTTNVSDERAISHSSESIERSGRKRDQNGIAKKRERWTRAAAGDGVSTLSKRLPEIVSDAIELLAA